MLGFFTLFRSRLEHENSNHKTPASTPVVHGMAAFLMDATSGKVLIDMNSHARLPIASAANLTRLAGDAIQLSTFAQVVAQQDYAVSARPHNHRYLWHTTNTLLATYPGMNDIESGYDVQAGAFMVFSAQRNDRLLIGTELHAQSENELASDVRKLLDRGFAS